MLFRDMTKAQRERLRELAAIAYERQLSVELGKLEAEFARWRAGKLDGHELSDRIHAFHDGPSRKLYSRYTDTHSGFNVAAAIVDKTLSESEVDVEILELLRERLDLLRNDISKS